MNNDIALSIIKARETAGLSQRDICHLLGIAPSVLSRVESGQRTPSIQLATGLSIVFGCSLEALLTDLHDTMRAEIAARLLTLNDYVRERDHRSNRSISLQRLRDRLETLSTADSERA